MVCLSASQNGFNLIILKPFCGITRPVEWGKSYHRPTDDFSKEVQTTGPLLVQGWYSSLGDTGYIETAGGATPYTYVPYGAFAINIIC